jgi:sec-independent protein translocase protein TatA
MGEFSPIHWLILIAVIVLLFGGRRIPEVMRGMGEGIRSFKDGMRGDSQASATTVNPAPPAQSASTVAPAPPAPENK